MALILIFNRAKAGSQRSTVVAGTPWSEFADMAVRLIKVPFTASNAITFLDADEADFGGYAAKAPEDVDVIYDTLTSLYYLRLKEPLGGWNWVTAGTTNLPQTIYGIAVTGDDIEDGIGVCKLPSAVPLNAGGQIVVAGDIWVPIDSSLFQTTPIPPV